MVLDNHGRALAEELRERAREGRVEHLLLHRPEAYRMLAVSTILGVSREPGHPMHQGPERRLL